MRPNSSEGEWREPIHHSSFGERAWQTVFDRAIRDLHNELESGIRDALDKCRAAFARDARAEVKNSTSVDPCDLMRWADDGGREPW